MAKRLNRKTVHSLCLLCGSLGLLSVSLIHDKYLLLLSMVGVGIAWGFVAARVSVALRRG